VQGTIVSEWLEGEGFLIQRTHLDHPDFPDSIIILVSIERDRRPLAGPWCGSRSASHDAEAHPTGWIVRDRRSVSFSCDVCSQFGGVGDGMGDFVAEVCRDAVEGL
jgi:hypothetical protein